MCWNENNYPQLQFMKLLEKDACAITFEKFWV